MQSRLRRKSEIQQLRFCRVLVALVKFVSTVLKPFFGEVEQHFIKPGECLGVAV